MYDRDYTTDIEIDGMSDPVPATFSTWLGHPDDLPSLTLETVTLGKLQLNREQMIAWLGAVEIDRIEKAYVPETWDAQDHREY